MRQPFLNFLAALRENGLPAGFREHARLRKLLDHWHGTDAAELRDALAALFARDASEARLVRDLFDQQYLNEPALRPTQQPATRGWRPIIIMLLLAGVAGGLFRVLRTPAAIPTGPIPTAAPTSARGTEHPPPAPKPPEPVKGVPVHPEGQRLPVVLGSALFCLLLVALVYRVRRRHEVESFWDAQSLQQLDALPDPRQPNPQLHKTRSFDRDDLDDAAAALRRSRQPFAGRSSLHVARSLAATVRNGGAPTPVFRDRQPEPNYWILLDESREMRPWRAKVNALLSALVARGVHLEVMTFDGGADHVSRGQALLSLEKLAGTVNDGRIALISTGSRVLDERGELAPWARTLSRFPRRVFWHPAADARLQRSALRRLKTPVFPLSRLGLLRGAVQLNTEDPTRFTADAPEFVPAVTRADVERLRQLASLAADADAALLDTLRQEILPDSPEATTARLLELYGDASGDALWWTSEELVRNRLALHRQAPEQERAVHALLRHAMQASEPPAASAAHLRWRLQLALRDLAAPPDAAARGDAVSTLEELALGPLRVEAVSSLENADRLILDDSSEAEAERRHARRAASALRSRPAPAGHPVSPPGLQELLIGLAALGVAFGASKLLPVEAPTIENVRDAYRVELRAEDDTLRISRGARSKGAPEQCRLYRDGQDGQQRASVAANAAALIGSLPSGHWYECRARMSRGNWALSNQVYFPNPHAKTPPPPTPPDSAKPTPMQSAVVTGLSIAPVVPVAADCAKIATTIAPILQQINGASAAFVSKPERAQATAHILRVGVELLSALDIRNINVRQLNYQMVGRLISVSVMLDKYAAQSEPDGGLELDEDLSFRNTSSTIESRLAKACGYDPYQVVPLVRPSALPAPPPPVPAVPEATDAGASPPEAPKPPIALVPIAKAAEKKAEPPAPPTSGPALVLAFSLSPTEACLGDTVTARWLTQGGSVRFELQPDTRVSETGSAGDGELRFRPMRDTEVTLIGGTRRQTLKVHVKDCRAE